MDNSRKHDSIGTKTHRTAPLETSASEQQPQNTTTSDVATSEAVKTNMAATNPPNFNTTNPGGNNGIVQNTTVAATTPAAPAAPATPAAATTISSTSTPAASSAAINSAPTTTALVLANKPIFLASAPPYFVAAGMPPGAGAPGSVSGGPSPYPPGAHAGTSTSNKTFQRPAVFNKVNTLSYKSEMSHYKTALLKFALCSWIPCIFCELTKLFTVKFEFQSDMFKKA